MLKLLNMVCNTFKDIKYVGKLESVLLIRVTLPPLDKYIIFQLAK